jgi:tetratricopeptide (TPR) repeat protein
MSPLDWFKWLWQQVEQCVTAHEAVLVVGLAAITALLTAITALQALIELLGRKRQKREVAQARAPFEILRTQGELMTYLFPNPERRILPDAEIPYLDRVGRGLDEVLAQKSRLLISGISKCGKTREAAELIRRLRRTRDVTVLALKPNAWLERPDPQRDAWLEQVPKRGLVLLVDEMDSYCLPVATREGATLPSFQDRLQTIIDYFEATCGRDEMWVLSTVRSEAPRWERLGFPDHPLWHDFTHYPLASLGQEETERLVEHLEGTEQIPPVTPEARATIAAANDGTFLRPILFFREKLEEKTPRITPSEAEDFARDLRQEFAARYQRAVQADPACRHVYAALDLLRQAQVAPYAFLVRELAAGLADGRPWRRFWLQRRLSRALERLTVSEIPCREELLFPYEGQADVAQATLAEGRVDLLSRFLLTFTCRCPYHRLLLLFGDRDHPWLLLPSLFSFGYVLQAERKDYHEAICMWERVIQLDPQDAMAYNNRGAAYADLGQHQWAIRDYDQAIRLDPKDAAAYYNRGNAYADLGQHERAIQDFDQAIQLDPKLAMAYSNRGAAYAALGQHQRAIQDYDQAIQLDPKLAMAYNNRGVAYRNLGQPQRAIQDLDQAIQLDPKDAAAYGNRGAAYAALGQHERAIQDFDQTIQFDPKDAAAYYNRGLAYGALGQHQWAIRDYDQAVQLDPKLARAYSHRGLAYADLGQPQRAIQDLDQALQLDPKLARAYNNRGFAYAALGQHQRAIQLDPKLAMAYSNRGFAYAALGQHERAIQDCDQAVQLDPKLAMAYNNRGATYLDLGQSQRTIQDCDQAIKLDPKLAMAYYNRGAAYLDLGQLQRAIQDCDQAIQLDPNYAMAYYNRGIAYRRLGQLERAIQDYDQAIQLNPKHATAYGNRGLVHLALGDYEQAIADFNHVLTLDPKDARAHYALAYVWARQKDLAKALEHLRHAIEVDPQAAAWATSDKDFDSIREDPRFRALVGV